MLIALAVAAWPACSGENPNYGPADMQAVAPGCARDADCKGARICMAGACVDPAPDRDLAKSPTLADMSIIPDLLPFPPDMTFICNVLTAPLGKTCLKSAPKQCCSGACGAYDGIAGEYGFCCLSPGLTITGQHCEVRNDCCPWPGPKDDVDCIDTKEGKRCCPKAGQYKNCQGLI
jgi:hypothetical protein